MKADCKCISNESNLLKIGEVYKWEKFYNNYIVYFYNNYTKCSDLYAFDLEIFEKHFITLRKERKLKLEKINENR